MNTISKFGILLLMLNLHTMIYPQLNEQLISKNLETIYNKDFRKTTENDWDDWEIEYESNYYYKPYLDDSFTFIGYPIASASFFVDTLGTITHFGIYIETNESDDFFDKMVKTYGDEVVSVLSENYLQKKGIVLPTEENEEASNIIQQIPIPTTNEFKELHKITWFNIFNKSHEKGINIMVYNIPLRDYGMPSSRKKLRILFTPSTYYDD